MIPREAVRGQSFKGAGQYYLHDKGALTSERVEFTHTENVPTNDPQKALKWMAWTAIHAEDLKREAGSKMTGRPCTKPVFTFSLSWHPEQEPKKWEMIGAGRRALIALGLQDHETVMVAHNDCEHPHLHVITSVIDPETGKANRVPFSKKKLSLWAEEYELEHGKVYCKNRVENNEIRADEKVKHEHGEVDRKAIITKLYRESDSGAAFQTALGAQGFRLAQGKKLVLIDRNGNIHSLSRQIDGAREKEVRAKLADLKFPDVETARKNPIPGVDEEACSTKEDARNSEGKPSEEQEYFDRDRQEQDWQESIIEAAVQDTDKTLIASDHPDVKVTKSVKPPSPPKGKPDPRKQLKRLFPKPEPRRATPAELNRLQDRQLAELGNFYTQTTHARLALAQTLDRQYGEQERKLRDDIAQLENVLNNSNWFRVRWLKFTKQIPKTAEEDLNGMRQTLQNIEWRQAEARSAVEVDAESRRKEIAERHRLQKLELRSDPFSENIRTRTNDSVPEPDENEHPSLDY